MSTDKKDIREHADIREQAAHWAGRMHDAQDALEAVEREQFEKWVSADPVHAQEFREMNLMIMMTTDIAAAHRDRWTADIPAPVDVRAHSRRQVVRYWAIAASFIALVILGGFYARTQSWFGGSSYITHTGEMRTVTLPEGSVAYLNTRTEVRWAGTGRDRRVELTEGEALFDVVHDSERPFRVVLDNSEIRVLGTRFNVFRKPNNGNTIVTVIEGAVEVRGFASSGSAQPAWSRQLGPNQQLEYSSLGLVREPQETDAQEVGNWRSGIYRFRDQPVEVVLDRLTRYTDQHIVIRDPRIAELRINGALSTRDVRDALRRLQDLAPVEVKENANTFTLDYRAPGQGKD